MMLFNSLRHAVAYKLNIRSAVRCHSCALLFISGLALSASALSDAHSEDTTKTKSTDSELERRVNELTRKVENLTRPVEQLQGQLAQAQPSTSANSPTPCCRFYSDTH